MISPPFVSYLSRAGFGEVGPRNVFNYWRKILPDRAVYVDLRDQRVSLYGFGFHVTPFNDRWHELVTFSSVEEFELAVVFQTLRPKFGG